MTQLNCYIERKAQSYQQKRKKFFFVALTHINLVFDLKLSSGEKRVCSSILRGRLFEFRNSKFEDNDF